MSNDERWQGEVDTKLDVMGKSIDRLHAWTAAHEVMDGERFARLETLIDHDQQQRKQLVQLTEAIIGNGQEGLKTRTARLEQTVGGVRKFLWLIAGAAISAGTVAVFAFFL